MTRLVAASPLFLSLIINNIMVVSAGPRTLLAKPGQNIILPCRTDNRPVLVVEWSRTDLESYHVLLYRDDQIDAELQHPSYQNRVDLQDRQMKDGDVSLVLNNVTLNDTGTYECKVVYGEPDLSMKLLNTTHLSVAPPGDKEGRGDNREDQDGDSRGLLGLVALPVLAVILAAAVAVYLYRTRLRNKGLGGKKKSSPEKNQDEMFL